MFVKAKFTYVGDTAGCKPDGNEPTKLPLKRKYNEALLIEIEMKCRGGSKLKIAAPTTQGDLGRLCNIGSVEPNVNEDLAEGYVYHLLCPTNPSDPTNTKHRFTLSTPAGNSFLDIEVGPDMAPPPAVESVPTVTTPPVPTATPMR
jgi:hypothetical protein